VVAVVAAVLAAAITFLSAGRWGRLRSRFPAEWPLEVDVSGPSAGKRDRERRP
jgi:hypothetical protein